MDIDARTMRCRRHIYPAGLPDAGVVSVVQPQHRGAPLATMTDEEAMQKLLASGLIAQPATRPFKLPKPIPISVAPDGKTMSDWVIEMRGAQ